MATPHYVLGISFWQLLPWLHIEVEEFLRTQPYAYIFKVEIAFNQQSRIVTQW